VKIVAISDTHGFHDRVAVPDGDVLIHCGDSTIYGNYAEVATFLTWFSSQPHRHKLFIAGNHDWLFAKSIGVALSRIPPNVTYLQDNAATIDGVKFWGSPWQPEFCGWAFNLPRGRALADKWATIPDDVDVLITHGPPAGILDTIRPAGLPLGCGDLRERVANMPRLKLHAFGHIHGGYGVRQIAAGFVNASVCDEAYNPVNAPVVVDLAVELSSKGGGGQ
jgi:predicted phosphodiesterase